MTKKEFDFAQLEELLQAKISEGWKNFNEGDRREFYARFHTILFNLDEYSGKNNKDPLRRHIPHAPYEYTAKDICAPFRDLCIHLGIIPIFPVHNIEAEYPKKTEEMVQYPIGRRDQFLIMFYNGQEPKELCRISLEFILLHEKLHGQFGFEEPRLKIIATYPENHPEDFVHLERALREIPHYEETKGETLVMRGEVPAPASKPVPVSFAEKEHSSVFASKQTLFNRKPTTVTPATEPTPPKPKTSG